MAYAEYEFDLSEDGYENITWLSHVGWNITTFDPIVVTGAGTDYDFSNNTIESGAVGVSGYGGWKGEIWMGRYLNPTADQETTRTVNLSYDGDIKAFIVAAAGGSAEIKVESCIKNTTTNNIVKEETKNYKAQTIGGSNINEDWYEYMDFAMSTEYKYKMFVKLTARIDVQVLAEASADVAQNVDGSERVKINDFSIWHY